MKKTVLVVSLFSILFFVNLAHAQFAKSTGPRFYSEFKPVVGGWSEYEMKSKNEPPMKMKIAIVGKEGDAYWYETVTEEKQGGKIVSKMLVSGNPNDTKNVKRMIFKMGNEPAMEMPVQMMQQGSGSKDPKGKMIDKGAESIKVPAGTFSTNHYQYQDAGVIVDSWVYKDVSPYGLIKSQSKDFEMVLVGYGTGAKTLITETPKKFQMPAMPGKSLKPGTPPNATDEEDDDNGNANDNDDDD